jgi:hypothetical protein
MRIGTMLLRHPEPCGVRPLGVTRAHGIGYLDVRVGCAQGWGAGATVLILLLW